MKQHHSEEKQDALARKRALIRSLIEQHASTPSALLSLPTQPLDRRPGVPAPVIPFPALQK